MITEQVEVLRRASAMIKERGWRQGSNTTDGRKGRLCAGDAVYAADFAGLPNTQKLLAKLESLACCTDIAEWNDVDGRTEEEVLRLFELAVGAA